MSEAQLDELFGEGGTAARPRTARILAVLISGLVLTITGMACTAVPGGLVTLVAWHLVEKEVDRVDSGFLPLEHRPALITLRRAVWAGLFLVVLLFLVQSILLVTGTYFQLWAAAIEMLRPLVLPTKPVPPTP